MIDAVADVIDYIYDWDIDIDHYDLVKLLIDTKGDPTIDQLSDVYFDPKVYADATGDTDYLDVNDDYDGYDKLYPVITFTTKNGRDIVSPRGFVKYMLAQVGITGADLSDIDDDPYAYGDSVSFTFKDYGWTWIQTGHTDPKGDVIYYTFGGALGGGDHPVCQYVTDTDDAW